jgi:neutral ceramidase
MRIPFDKASAVLAASLILLAACDTNSPGGHVGAGDGDASGDLDGAIADNRLARCAVNSPLRAVGAGRNASGALEGPVAATPVTGSCADAGVFAFGSGIADITGVVADVTGMGYESPTHILHGIHQRQFARAFAFASPCNGKRVMFVVTDTGMVFGHVRAAVLEAIEADATLGPLYAPDNVMLSATHTHEGPAGYSAYEAHNFFHLGFDPDTHAAIVAGIVEAIRRANANLQAHPEPAPVRIAIGELLDTSTNRSPPAYALNPASERAAYVDARGDEIDTDKRFLQLSLVRADGSPVGALNWFGVHPTSLGNANPYASSDNKGFAALGFEKLMGTRYVGTGTDDDFVAGFAQTDEGDSSPNIFIFEKPFAERGGGADEMESNRIAGTKQLARALELFNKGDALRGPVDYRLFNVQMDQITVTDPAVLADLHHPPALDAATKRTCGGSLGVSFAAGAEDGPGFTTEGLSCASSPDLLAAAVADVQAGSMGRIPAALLSDVLLCNFDAQPLLDQTCQAEKAVLIPVGPLNLEPSVLPLQIFRVGNLALVGVPWEVTTMAARRLRASVLDILRASGVDTVVVAGLANEYVHYLTTREEYASQQYEGASNLFGPWSLAAVQQEMRRLAVTLRDGTAAPGGPATPVKAPLFVRTPYVASDLPGTGGFGALLQDAAPSYAQGAVASAKFQAGHPRNDLRRNQSYVYAERRNDDGSWTVIATDRDPELIFDWSPLLVPLPIDTVTGPSTAQALWTIPLDTPPGTYRLRHEGASAILGGAPVPYSGVSSSFTIAGAAAECP